LEGGPSLEDLRYTNLAHSKELDEQRRMTSKSARSDDYEQGYSCSRRKHAASENWHRNELCASNCGAEFIPLTIQKIY